MIKQEYKDAFDLSKHSPNTKLLEYGDKYFGTNIEGDVVKQMKDFDRNKWEKE